MYEKIFQTLQQHGAELITLGGRIHPYVGAAVAALLLFGMIWLGFKVKAEHWENEKKDGGEEIGGVGNDQNTTKPVLDQGDDFFGDGPKK